MKMYSECATEHDARTYTLIPNSPHVSREKFGKHPSRILNQNPTNLSEGDPGSGARENMMSL